MCPHCGKSTNCDCKSCIKNKNPNLKQQIWVDKNIGILKCPYCDKKYSIDESEKYMMKLYDTSKAN